MILNFRNKLTLLGCLGLLVTLFSQSGLVENPTLKVGASAVVITPKVGTPMAGYYYDRGTEGVHDDLYAKAIVLEMENKKVAIVSCDIVDVSDEMVLKARELAEKATGIPASNITISATHSHTGPVILSKDNIYSVEGKMGELLVQYNQQLPEMVARSIVQANDNLQPGDLFFGNGHEESIAFNRRFHMTDGTVGWNAGKMNPEIIRPAGPIDPQVSVLYGTSSQGKPITTFVNYALHLDITGGLEISADMPYTLSTILGKLKGNDMVTLFGQGCSGNINHLNVKDPNPQKGHGEAERIGTVLAGEVIKTYTRMDPLSFDRIQVLNQKIFLPLADISNEDLDQNKKIAASFGEEDAAPFMELVNAYKVLEVAGYQGKPLEVEVHVIALGDELAIVSLPGEVFTELGIYIKQRSPFKNTMVVELSNNTIGYIADRKGYVEGNYEPVSSRVAPGSGEILVERALEMLAQLKSQ